LIEQIKRIYHYLVYDKIAKSRGGQAVPLVENYVK